MLEEPFAFTPTDHSEVGDVQNSFNQFLPVEISSSVMSIPAPASRTSSRPIPSSIGSIVFQNFNLVFRFDMPWCREFPWCASRLKAVFEAVDGNVPPGCVFPGLLLISWCLAVSGVMPVLSAIVASDGSTRSSALCRNQGWYMKFGRQARWSLNGRGCQVVWFHRCFTGSVPGSVCVVISCGIRQ